MDDNEFKTILESLLTYEESLNVANILAKFSWSDINSDNDLDASIAYKLGMQGGLSLRMRKWMEHEESRWEEYDRDELHDRLLRIKNPLKLQAFIMMAQKYASKGLYVLACNRARDLGYGWIIPREDKFSILSKDKKEPVPKIRKVRP